MKEQLLVGVDEEVYFKVLLADRMDLKTISSNELLNKITCLETAYVTECTENADVNRVKSYSQYNSFKNSENNEKIMCKCCGKKGHASNIC